jgi:flagellar FliJ protein
LPFRFRLERVLRFREEKERGKRLEVSLREEDRRRALEELGAAEALLRQSWEAGWSDAAEACHLILYRDFLLRLRTEREAALEAAEERLDAARERLLAARRERLVLERLRERHRAAYLAEEAARELKVLDELGTYTFFRNRERR